MFSGAEVSDCGHYVIITISEGCDPVNKLYYCDLRQLDDGIKGKDAQPRTIYLVYK